MLWPTYAYIIVSFLLNEKYPEMKYKARKM